MNRPQVGSVWRWKRPPRSGMSQPEDFTVIVLGPPRMGVGPIWHGSIMDTEACKYVRVILHDPTGHIIRRSTLSTT
jgi:hypothetical protein